MVGAALGGTETAVVCGHGFTTGGKPLQNGVSKLGSAMFNSVVSSSKAAF